MVINMISQSNTLDAEPPMDLLKIWDILHGTVEGDIVKATRDYMLVWRDKIIEIQNSQKQEVCITN